MKNKNCEERNELHEKFALATISYVAQVTKVSMPDEISPEFRLKIPHSSFV